MINISFQDKFKKENFPNVLKRNKIMLPQWKPANVKSKYDNTFLTSS